MLQEKELFVEDEWMGKIVEVDEVFHNGLSEGKLHSLEECQNSRDLPMQDLQKNIMCWTFLISMFW